MINKSNTYNCPCCNQPMRVDFQQYMSATGGYHLFTCDNRTCALSGFTLPAVQLDELKSDSAKMAVYTNGRVS